MRIRNFLERSFETAERPKFFEGDAAARYSHALKFCKGKSVLDVGTGFGVGAEFIAKNGAGKVLGIDHNSRLIEKISKLNKCKNLSFKYLDALELHRLDNKFDVILAFEVIEHLPAERVNEFITLLYDNIVPGGLLLLSTPNGLKTEYFLGSLYNPYHTKEYKEHEIKKLLSGYFPEVDVRGYKMVNQSYSKKSLAIAHSPLNRISYILGHFKLVRELLAFIPIGIKHLVTKENRLPVLTEKDYIFIKDVIDCYGLFALAKKVTAMRRYGPKLSIVIANYNGENYLRSCLDSLLLSNYNNFEIIICDDGSTDSSWSILKTYKHKNIRLVKNGRNLGASASRNKAVSLANGDIIVFLDNDTVVDRNWITNLVKPFLYDIRVGAAQALLMDLERKALIQHAGGVLIPQTGWLLAFHQWENYKQIKNKLKERKIVSVSAALAVRKDVFNLIDGFDELEAVHTEDIDFDWRIWLAGYKTVLAKDALVYHLSKSVERRSHMRSNNYRIYFHLAKNSFRSIIKNYEAKNVLRFLPQSLLINISRGILVLIRRGDPSAISATISAIAWNIVHFSNTLNERRLVQKTRLLSDEYIMREVFDKGSLLEIYNRNFKQTKLLW